MITPRGYKVIAIIGVIFFVLAVRLLSGGGKVRRKELQCVDIGDNSSRATPLIIYVSGTARTGTTYVYNLVRVMARLRDPNSVAGWWQDLVWAATRYASDEVPQWTAGSRPAQLGGVMDSYLRLGTSLVVKVHSVAVARRLFSGCDGKQEIEAAACPVSLVISSYRDLRTQAISNKRMNWVRKPAVADDIFKRDAASVCRWTGKYQDQTSPLLSESDWQQSAPWVSWALHTALCSAELEKAAGVKMKARVRFEDLREKEARLRWASKIGRLLGLNDEQINAAVEEADQLRSVDCASSMSVNPVTHYHRGHIMPTHVKSEIDRKGMSYIESDPDLAVWLKARNYL